NFVVARGYDLPVSGRQPSIVDEIRCIQCAVVIFAILAIDGPYFTIHRNGRDLGKLVAQSHRALLVACLGCWQRVVRPPMRRPGRPTARSTAPLGFALTNVKKPFLVAVAKHETVPLSNVCVRTPHFARNVETSFGTKRVPRRESGTMR